MIPWWGWALIALAVLGVLVGIFGEGGDDDFDSGGID
jgi:hypothetical protein